MIEKKTINTIKLRLDNIKKYVSMRNLIDFFKIRTASQEDETQVSCPFHADDRHPSARIYSTGTMFCWVCNRHWDIISFVKEYKNFSFSQTVSYLEKEFKIQVLDLSDLDLTNIDLLYSENINKEQEAQNKEIEDIILQKENYFFSIKKNIDFESYMDVFYKLDRIKFCYITQQKSYKELLIDLKTLKVKET